MNKTVKFPLLGAALSFVFISFISSELNNINFFQLIYFWLYTLFPIIYFYIILNEKNIEVLNKIKRIFIFLILLQLPAVFIKWIILGYSESGAIGTMGTEEGSLSAIFPLLISILLFSYYLTYRNKKYLLLIIGYFLFAIIGGKRVITLALPFFMLLTLLIFYKKNKRLFSFVLLKKIAVYSIIGFMLFFFSVKVQPTLNPENSYWGTFDLEYLTDYMFSYSSHGKMAGDVSRLEGLGLFAVKLYSEDTNSFLIGEGAGKLIASKFAGNKSANLIEENYGIFYGGRMGFLWIYMQIGILGLLFFLYIYLKSAFINNLNNHPLNIALLSIIFLFAFDFFYYSKVFITFPLINNLYFFLSALAYKASNNKLYLPLINKI